MIELGSITDTDHQPHHTTRTNGWTDAHCIAEERHSALLIYIYIDLMDVATGALRTARYALYIIGEREAIRRRFGGDSALTKTNQTLWLFYGPSISASGPP